MISMAANFNIHPIKAICAQSLSTVRASETFDMPKLILKLYHLLAVFFFSYFKNSTEIFTYKNYYGLVSFD